jgi:G3E family GTPase
MTKIDIVSGFLGAGKTTLIKKLLAEAYQGEKIVLIENEFGEISIDGGFLKETGVQINEMASGCICCSLVGDFAAALKQVQEQFHPDRILIEPSGVGKLSDVIVAVEDTVKDVPDMRLNSFVTVADAAKVKVYMKNFGEFYNNQIESAGTIILSRTQKLSQEKLEAAVALLREKNPDAAILTTPWDELDGRTVLSAVEKVSLADELLEKMRAEHEAEEAEHEHHHHHHDGMRGTDTIITTTAGSVTTPTALATMTTATTITIITPTKCSPVGAWKRCVSTPLRISPPRWTCWTAAAAASSCGPRASCPAPTDSGSTSTMCRRSRRSAPARPTTPAASASSVQS